MQLKFKRAAINNALKCVTRRLNDYQSYLHQGIDVNNLLIRFSFRFRLVIHRVPATVALPIMSSHQCLPPYFFQFSAEHYLYGD